MLTIGIDSGTQSTKSVVLDLENGEIIASSKKSYGMIGGLPPGHLEQHPQDWSEALDATISDCLRQIGTRRGEVAAIGVSGQQHGFGGSRQSGSCHPPGKTLVRHLDRAAVQAV